MKIDRCVFQPFVAQQNLNRAQIRSGFQHVGGVTMTQDVLVLLMICTRERFAIAITRGMA